MKTADIRKLEIKELKEKIEETKKDFMLLRFQAISGQLTDTSKVTKSKRIIARMETILREKQLSVKAEGEA